MLAELIFCVSSGALIFLLANWLWGKSQIAPEVREAEMAMLDVILCSLRHRPEEWEVYQLRVVNKQRGFSIWCPQPSNLAYAEGLTATWADGTAVPAEQREELWSAIMAMRVRKIVRKFDDRAGA